MDVGLMCIDLEHPPMDGPLFLIDLEQRLCWLKNREHTLFLFKVVG